MVSTSRDGGVTWKQHQVAPAIANGRQGAYDGCTVRTDSHGVVYVFFTHFGGTSLAGFHTVIKSLDGGQTWRQPQDVVAITDPCFHNDPVTGRCIIDGVAGARTDLAAMPSIDIANGAPTGADATNEIVDAWVDGRDGPDHEKAFFAYSTNGAASFSTPTPISPAGDISAYAAPAISPDGTAGLRDVAGVHPALPDDHGQSAAGARRAADCRDRGRWCARRVDDGVHRAARRCARFVAGPDPVQRVPRRLRLRHRHPRLWRRCVDRRPPYGRLPGLRRLASAVRECRRRWFCRRLGRSATARPTSATTTSSAPPPDRSQAIGVCPEPFRSIHDRNSSWILRKGSGQTPIACLTPILWSR